MEVTNSASKTPKALGLQVNANSVAKASHGAFESVQTCIWDSKIWLVASNPLQFQARTLLVY